jgi:hypothetical protein
VAKQATATLVGMILAMALSCVMSKILSTRRLSISATEAVSVLPRMSADAALVVARANSGGTTVVT